MIALILGSNDKAGGLGDIIDWCCTVNMFAEYEPDECIIYIDPNHIVIKSKKLDTLWKQLSSLFDRNIVLKIIDSNDYSDILLDISQNKTNSNIINDRYFKTKGNKYQKLLYLLGDFPKIKVKDYSEYFPDLPEKFVTMQWDANLKRRRCSKNKVKNITEFYENIGYKTIIVGGQAENDTLRNDLHKIAYIMSKASLHAGVDSGFMHLAKIVMPSNKIHIYTSNFMDPYISHHLKNVLKAGAVLNYSRYK